MRTIVAIGGGELWKKTTLKIDEYIVALARAHAGENRPNALFIPTASHDYMPYYNTFHKVYTGIFNVKTDVTLTVFKEVDEEKLNAKFDKADVIYVGGGDTVFMLESWKKTGLLARLRAAYERGVPIVGLSAGAICWFTEMYTDSALANGGDGEKYSVFGGLNWVNGIISPHYGARMLDFDRIVCYNYNRAYAIEDDAALVIVDGKVAGSVSSGGKAWLLERKDNVLQKTEIAPV